MNYNISYLDELESEAIYILREVAAQFEKSVLMFSGGKDSIVLVKLAQKAFSPKKIPFQLLHVDTGYNFPEVLRFRDDLVKNMNLDLVIASVPEAIKNGRLAEAINKDRNRLQIPVLLEIIKKKKYDAAIGGGRRDEEKARAKERIFSHRNNNGQWHPENQRPELWNLFNGNKKKDEHFRIFPLSNWTELDIWLYIEREKIEIPKIYFAHKRFVVNRDDVFLADSKYLLKQPNESAIEKVVRCRTIGDITTTGLWESNALTIEDIINEIAISSIGERGKRADDKISTSSMEDRKREGYF